jgi:hypothetical protein
MKFLTLRLSHLLSEQHLQFMKLFYRLLDKFPVVKNRVIMLYDILIGLLAQESQLVDAERGSALSSLIAEEDTRIDRTIVGINSIINAGLHHFNPVTVAAAHRVQVRMKAFGNIEDKSYEGEAAAIDILLDDMRGKFAGDVTILGLTDWITELDAAHSIFDELFEQRNTESTYKPDAKLKDIRKEVDDVYRDMIERIAAAATLDDAGMYIDFVRQLDQEIKYFNEHSPHRTRKDISNVAVGDIPPQQYTGEPIIVIPDVFYTGSGQETIKLVFAKDFSVTYRKNVEAGTAKIILHGQGGYKGSLIVTFNIFV